MSRKTIARWSAVAGLLVAGACLVSFGIQTLPVVDAASQTPSISKADKDRVDARLEKLHQRALNSAKAEEDDNAVQRAKTAAKQNSTVSPERAAELAVAANGGTGQLKYIVRKTDSSGKPYYQVQLGPSSKAGPGPGGPGKPTGRSLATNAQGADAASLAQAPASVKRLHIDGTTGAVSDGSNDPDN